MGKGFRQLVSRGPLTAPRDCFNDLLRRSIVAMTPVCPISRREASTYHLASGPSVETGWLNPGCYFRSTASGG